MNAPLPVTGRPQPLQTGVKLRGAEKVARIPVKILPTEEIPRKPEWIRVPIATSPEVARVKALLRRVEALAQNLRLEAGSLRYCATGARVEHDLDGMTAALFGTLPELRQRFPQAHVVALDLSPAMLRHVVTPCCRMAGDLEHLPLADACLDLFWSSLAVQWCDLPAVLREAHRLLRPAGHLALASLGPDTFHELRRAFAGVDEYRHTLAFHTADEIGQMAVAAGLSAVSVQRTTQRAHYADFKSLLRAVKAVGANQVGDGRRTGLMSRASFLRAEAAYEAQRMADGLPLTYDVLTLHAHP